MGIAAMIGVATAHGVLLFEFDANNDLDPNDGWDFTGAISGTLSTNLTAGGAIDRIVDPGTTQAYFRREAGDRGFGPSLGGIVSISNYSLEIWIRRQSIGTSEDFVFQFKNNVFNTTFMIAKAKEALPDDELDFIHQAPAGNRSTNNNIFNWPVDGWQHWVFNYQEASSDVAGDGVLTIVVNDGPPTVLSGQNPRYTGSPVIDTAEIFFSGNEWDRGMRGDIAIIRLHDNILTTEEITASFRATAVDLGLIVPIDVDFDEVSLANTMSMEFESDTSTEYTLQATSDLVTSSGWMNATTVIGTGTNMYFFDPTEPTGSATSKAYRIVTFF
jgi:hypothetical protein